jgi:transketolase
VSVLPPGVPRVAVEMGATDGWWKYGCDAVVGIDTFGESAPANVLFKHFGFTAQNVADTVRCVLGHAVVAPKSSLQADKP